MGWHRFVYIKRPALATRRSSVFVVSSSGRCQTGNLLGGGALQLRAYRTARAKSETKSVVSSERHRRLLSCRDYRRSVRGARRGLPCRSTVLSSTSRPFWCGLITLPILMACARARAKQRQFRAAVNAGTSPFWAAPLVHEIKESFRRAFHPSHVATAASGFELGIQLAEFEGRLNAAHGREYA